MSEYFKKLSFKNKIYHILFKLFIYSYYNKNIMIRLIFFDIHITSKGKWYFFKNKLTI